MKDMEDMASSLAHRILSETHLEYIYKTHKVMTVKPYLDIEMDALAKTNRLYFRNLVKFFIMIDAYEYDIMTSALLKLERIFL